MIGANLSRGLIMKDLCHTIRFDYYSESTFAITKRGVSDVAYSAVMNRVGNITHEAVDSKAMVIRELFIASMAR